MNRFIAFAILIIASVAANAQVPSQRVLFTASNPPTVCSPGRLYTNATQSKVWLGTSASACSQIAGAGSAILIGDSPTATGAWTFSKAGAVSLPTITMSGAPLTGGTGTTTFPLFDLNTSGAAARTAMSTSGTMFGMNAPSGFAGNFLDFSVNGGASVFRVSSTGLVTSSGSMNPAELFVVTTGRIGSSTLGSFSFQSDGVLKVNNTAGTDFGRLQLGGTTSSFPAIKRNSNGIDIRLADDSNYANLASGTQSTYDASGNRIALIHSTLPGIRIISTGIYGFSSSVTDAATSLDTTISRNAAGIIQIGTTVANSAGTIKAAAYLTDTNCADSAGAAACGSASAGSFVIDAASTSTVVSTTAITANSEVFIQRDDSLGARLGITCNTQSGLVLGTPRVTARTAATSFTVTIELGPTTNPLCASYKIVN